MPRSSSLGFGGLIALIAAMMTITAMSIDINLPAVPITAELLGASLTTAQLTVTLFFLGFALGQLLWGSLSDGFGRKPILLLGFALYELATIGCALAPDMPSLLALRVAQGFAAGAGSVLSRAISATCSPASRWRVPCRSPWRPSSPRPSSPPPSVP